ncbi:hypothetical protein [Yersinia enterocolitica]|uniref:hypothetical protein n=1 Tax=Yersinia enterocolitica TaxID=630 RepID=UPI003D78B4DC
MSNINGGSFQGLDQGKGSVSADKLGMFLKVFAGEVLTAFQRRSVTMDKITTRTITSGKSASFPVLGRASAHYLLPSESLDDKRSGMKATEKVITIDGLLTADCLIFDIESAMNHFDVRAEYANQLGESIAIASDASVLAEIAKLANTDENIEGLGAPSVLEIGDKATLSEPKVLGQAVIDYLIKARGSLTHNYVLSGDRYVYVLPETYSAILAALGPNAANFSALGDLEKGVLTNVAGFTIVEVPHFVQGGADGKHSFPTTGKVTSTNVVALIAHRSAVGQVKLKDTSIERARRPEYQADQVIAKCAVGIGGLRPEASGALVFTA